MDIRTKIRLLRTARGWSQADLARASGIGGNFVSAIESGLIPRYEQRLLAALGYTPALDDLLAQLATGAPDDAAAGAGA